MSLKICLLFTSHISVHGFLSNTGQPNIIEVKNYASKKVFFSEQLAIEFSKQFHIEVNKACFFFEYRTRTVGIYDF
jgi:hypothetical protein